MASSVTRLVEALVQYQLLEPAQVKELVVRLRPEQLQPVRLAGELIRRDLCTTFQMQMLFAGRGRELVLGQYTLLEPLGEGGMGQVYKARHRRLHRIDTLKVIRPERVTSPAALERFLQEARAAVQLAHPNILGIHDANESNGLHFLAMEHVPGIDLARLVRQVGPLPPGFACHFLRQVALALDHAHQCGIIHRDIKPANMLLNLDLDTVTVLDMGLARLPLVQGEANERSRRGLLMGTPDYMAPEQALDPHSVDGRADVYSLGCSLYFLLASVPPFPSGTVTQKLMAHQQQEPPPLQDRRPDLPAGLAALCRRAMAKAPDGRFLTSAEMAAALAPFDDYPACPTALASTGGTAVAGLRRRIMTAAAPPLPALDDAALGRLLTADNRYVVPATTSTEFSLNGSLLAEDVAIVLAESTEPVGPPATVVPPTLAPALLVEEPARVADTILADPGPDADAAAATPRFPPPAGDAGRLTRLIGGGAVLASGFAVTAWAAGQWVVPDLLLPGPDGFLRVLVASLLVATPAVLLGHALVRSGPGRRSRTGRSAAGRTFTGLLRCGRCGKLLTVQVRNRTVEYRCPCLAANAGAPLSEAAFLRAVGELVRNLRGHERFLAGATALLRERYGEGQVSHEQEIARLQPHLLALQTCIHRAYEDQLTGAVSGAELRGRVAEWRAQQEALLRQVAAHLQGSQHRLEEGAALRELIEPDTGFEAMPPVEQRRLLEFLATELRWDGSRLGVQYRPAFALLATTTEVTPASPSAR